MDETAFWALLDDTRRKDCDAHAGAVRERLESLAPEEIVSFGSHLQAQLIRAHSWDLWGAAYIINGGCSDDGFEYFRGWLILQGRSAFENALRDPETLVEVVHRPDVKCEDILYVPFQAYEAVTGSELPRPSGVKPRDPTGQPWEEEDLDARFPRLTKAFG